VGQFELFPFEELGHRSEVHLLNKALSAFGKVLLPLETFEWGVVHQPTMLVHIPMVLAKSADQASSIAEEEVGLLNDLLALHRGSYGVIIGTFIEELQTKRSYFRVNKPTYTGNLLGGALSGESASHIADGISRARGDSLLQLHLVLYREALMEERTEFAYFRFWNLLEIMARNRPYIGQPLRDWQGVISKNRKGRDRRIEDYAEQIVFEHLRREFTTHNLSRLARYGLQHEDIVDQVRIWYRHRNCLAHSGGCFPQDSNFCDRNSPKHVNCRKAHEEIIAGRGVRDLGTDGYLSRLIDTVRNLVLWELV